MEVSDYGGAVAVWWGICKTRRITPMVYEGSFDSPVFIEVLERLTGPGLSSYVIQQDGAQCHVAQESSATSSAIA